MRLAASVFLMVRLFKRSQMIILGGSTRFDTYPYVPYKDQKRAFRFKAFTP